MADLHNKMKNQLETIINTVHDGIIAINEEHAVSVFNSVAEELFALTREEILEKNYQDKLIQQAVFSYFKDFKDPGSEAESFVKIRDKHVVYPGMLSVLLLAREYQGIAKCGGILNKRLGRKLSNPLPSA